MTQIIQIQTSTSFEVDFNANGTTYRLEIVFNLLTDKYYFNLYRLRGLVKLLSGVSLATGTNLLSQFPQWFKMWVAPVKPELYSKDPSSATITDYQIWIEDEG